MKCILCGKRKGKRQCPAKASLICSQCCGEKRMVEFRCPPCSYMTSGVDFELEKKFNDHISRTENPEAVRRYYEVKDRLGDVVDKVEREIVSYASELRTITDSQVHEAIELCEKNCRSAAKGVIYRHPSSDIIADRLSDRLMDTIEDEDGDLKERRILTTSDMSDCFFALRFDAEYFREQGRGPSAYLHHLALLHAGTQTLDDPEPLILI